MNEIVFEIGDVNPFATDPNAIPEENSVTVTKNGRDYKKIIYSCLLDPLKRIAMLFKALILTLYSAFFGLISKDLRDMWYQGVSGREPISVLTAKPISREGGDFRIHGDILQFEKSPEFQLRFGSKSPPLSPTKLSPARRIFTPQPIHEHAFNVLQSPAIKRVLKTPVDHVITITIPKTPSTPFKTYVVPISNSNEIQCAVELDNVTSDEISHIFDEQHITDTKPETPTQTVALVVPNPSYQPSENPESDSDSDVPVVKDPTPKVKVELPKRGIDFKKLRGIGPGLFGKNENIKNYLLYREENHQFDVNSILISTNSFTLPNPTPIISNSIPDYSVHEELKHLRDTL